MKKWIQDHLVEILLGVSVVGVGSLVVYDHLKSRRRLTVKTVGRSRTKVRKDSRDLSDALIESDNKKVEKVSTPNSRAKMASIESRSSSNVLLLKPRTSKVIGNDKRPLNNSFSTIRKYPSSYYSLNKKQQWKFRKQFNSPRNPNAA